MPPLVLRQMQDSALNHGPAINNIAWVLLVISALFILTRVVVKWTISKKFETEEVLIIMSLVSILFWLSLWFLWHRVDGSKVLIREIDVCNCSNRICEYRGFERLWAAHHSPLG